MQKNIEIELRGPLSKKEFNNLKSFLDKNAEFLDKKERLGLIYYPNEIPDDLTTLKDDPIELRIRITNKQPELMLKHGNWAASGAERKEIQIPLTQDKIQDAIDFLLILGWKHVIAHPTISYNYKYKEIEFSLRNSKNFYYYEAEIMAESNEINLVKEKIKKVCKELNLKEYSKEEFIELCNKLNQVKEWRFDFSKNTLKDVKKEFKEFF